MSSERRIPDAEFRGYRQRETAFAMKPMSNASAERSAHLPQGLGHAAGPAAGPKVPPDVTSVHQRHDPVQEEAPLGRVVAAKQARPLPRPNKASVLAEALSASSRLSVAGFSNQFGEKRRHLKKVCMTGDGSASPEVSMRT